MKPTYSKAIAVGVVLAALLIGHSVWSVDRVRAIGEVDGRVQFGLITLLPAVQNARLNFVRVEPDDSGTENPNSRLCRVELKIFDGAGRAFGTPDTFELRPGIAISRDIIPAGATQIEGQFRFRATYRVIDDPNIRCNVIPTLEVFNKETGGTLFLSPAIIRGFNPQPDPPGTN